MSNDVMNKIKTGWGGGVFTTKYTKGTKKRSREYAGQCFLMGKRK